MNKRQLYITGSRETRPAAQRVAYCDGGIDAGYRDGIDIELSHWIPNCTPLAFKASTSTEICLRFAAAGDLDSVDLVVNNHVDTDGMLSVYALLQPQTALAHRDTLVQAAGMGDFNGWGEPAAQHLFQLIALTRQQLQAVKTDPLDIYRQVHALVHRALAGEHFVETEAGLATLQTAVADVTAGRITRTPLGPRLVQYVLPGPVADNAWLPKLDEPLTASADLPPQARARWDAECVQLVCRPHPGGGWLHDLCWPGYAWAETVGLWRPPGLQQQGSSNRHELGFAPLDLACATLNEQDPAHPSASGRWCVAQALGPFEALPGRRFPVVLSFMQAQQPVASQLDPSQVAAVLGACLRLD